VNKLIVAPSALAISVVAPWAVTPLLMLGGAFLCYEGFEKVAHKLLHSKAEDDAHHRELIDTVADTQVDMVAFEKEKIRGAVRTDFILSAEIVVITLGTVAGAPFATQLAVLCAIAALMTVWVYGLVAGIVKLDDAGMALRNKTSGAARALGGAIVRLAPLLMKFLSVAGTVAMFLVGGGILTHGTPPAHHLVTSLVAKSGLPGVLVSSLAEGLVGVVAGAVILALVTGGKRVFRRSPRGEPGEPGSG
jgi:predicted DNA repair protein MutK